MWQKISKVVLVSTGLLFIFNVELNELAAQAPSEIPAEEHIQGTVRMSRDSVVITAGGTKGFKDTGAFKLGLLLKKYQRDERLHSSKVIGSLQMNPSRNKHGHWLTVDIPLTPKTVDFEYYFVKGEGESYVRFYGVGAESLFNFLDINTGLLREKIGEEFVKVKVYDISVDDIQIKAISWLGSFCTRNTEGKLPAEFDCRLDFTK